MKKNLIPLKQLHFDLITNNIIPLLPSKSLIRFTTTCKTWYHLIKSPKFISNHLNVNISDDNVQQLLFLGENLCYVLVNQELIEHAKLDCSIWYLAYWNTVVASCNGLIFILGKRDYGDYFGREYLLWNPSIKKTKKVESKVVDYSYHGEDHIMFNHELFGLGFHESSNDHRVVRIIYVIDDMLRGVGHVPTEVDVYSLSTDSWHKVDSNPGKLVGTSGGCFVNGVVHWLATTEFTMITMTPDDDCIESILLFGIQDESFSEMVLPEDLHYRLDSVISFKEFKGSLAILISEFEEAYSMNYLWVMTDYGLIESWNKYYTIINGESLISRWAGAILKSGILICYEQNEEEDEEKTIVFFDVNSGQAQKTFKNWPFQYSEVMDFVDSLVMF